MVDVFRVFVLGVVADVCSFFNFGIAVGYCFCIYLLRRIYSCFAFLLGHSHPPTYTLSPTHPHSEGVTLTRIASH